VSAPGGIDVSPPGSAVRKTGDAGGAVAHSKVTAETTLSGRMGRGTLGGIAAGTIFAGIEIWSAISNDLPVRAPFLAISTIVLGDSALTTGEANVLIGLLVHTAISIFYGMLFGLLTPVLRTNGTVALAGLAYGALIYLIDLQLIAPIWFPLFTTGDQSFSLLVHLLFGIVLGIAFFSADIRHDEPLVSVGRPARTTSTRRTGLGSARTDWTDQPRRGARGSFEPPRRS